VAADPERPPWQARIRRSPGGGPAGGGVLCGDRWVLTCAHVAADGPGPPEQVWVEFPFSGGGLIAARVAAGGWHPPGPGNSADLALLELAGELPGGALPAPLWLAGAQVGHGFRVFGFPKGHDLGVPARGEVAGPAHGEWTQLLADAGRGHLIDRGFSGSPVWDEHIGAVTGIVVTRDLNSSVRGGYAIAMDVVIRYLPQLAAWVGWRVSADADFDGYWDPRARGVDRGTRRGSYFTGRHRARQEVLAWAGDLGRRPGIRVVTGGPGSGKSALIAHLLMLSDPWLRSKLREQEQLAGDIAAVPAGWVSVAVRATGLDRAGVTAKLADGLSVPAIDPDTFLSALNERMPRPTGTVVIDGLDEAESPAEAERIARALLVPMAADAHLPVLVGTRRGYNDRLVRAFGSRAVVCDLDDPAYFELDDLVRYALASLRLDHDRGSDSPYRGHPSADLIARAIASAAGASFLVAGLSARALADDLVVIDTTVPDWQARRYFPDSVEAAMEEYLRHVPNRELLVPLAYARPPGLPHVLWPELAAAYTRRAVGNAELDAFRHSAGAYLIEPTGSGSQPTVGLFHQALTDYVRGQAREQAVEADFVQVLTDRARNAGGWEHSDEYTRHNLATHAAAAGRLDELVVDPGFLLAAEPRPLVSALHSLGTEGWLAVATYRHARHHMERASAADRHAYLELSARLAGATALADRAGMFATRARWRPVWAIGSPPRQILAHHQHFVFALAVGDVDAEAVALSGGPDGLVRATELATAEQLGDTVVDGGRAVMNRPGVPVSGVAFGQRNGKRHAIASFSDGQIRARDLQTLSEEFVLVPAHAVQPEHWVLLACAPEDPLVATCDMDEDVRIWNLESGTVVAELCHPGGVTRLAAGQIGDAPVLVSGGFDGTIRVWDFRTGKRRGRSYRASKGQVHTLATIALEDHLVVLTSALTNVNEQGYGHPGKLRARDITAGRLVQPLTGQGVVAGRLGAAMLHGQPVIAVSDGSVSSSLIDGRSGERLVPDLRLGGQTIALAPAEVDGRIGVVAGYDGGVVEVITAGILAGPADSPDQQAGGIDSIRTAESARVLVGGIERDHVMLWDIATGAPQGVPAQAQDRKVSCFDLCSSGGRLVAAAGSESPGRILAWDAESGRVIADESAGACGQVRVATAEGRTVIVGIDEELRVWDVATGPLWRTRLPGLSSFRIPTPQPLVYSDHGFSAVLWWNASASAAWDLFTGTRLRTPRHGHIDAAAVATVGQRATGIIGTDQGLILTWDLRTGKPLHEPFQCEGIVDTLAVAERVGPTTLLAAADNRIWEWDLLDGRLRGATEYPGETVTALAVARLADADVLCVGMRSGRVHLPQLDLTIELDEPIGEIWGVSGDRLVVTMGGAVAAIHVRDEPS
jgi:WD40 repeat protein